MAKVASPVSNSSSKFPSISTISESSDPQQEPDVSDSSKSDECGTLGGEAFEGGDDVSLAMAAICWKIPGIGSTSRSAKLEAATGLRAMGGTFGHCRHCARVPVLAYVDITSFGV